MDLTLITFPQVGVYFDMAPADYHKPQECALEDRILSKSMLWKFRQSPLRFKATGGKGPDTTKEMAWGSLVDCLALTPDRFGDTYALTPATYKAPENARKDAQLIDKPWNWNAKDCKAWRAKKENMGLEVVKRDDLHRAQEAVRALKANDDYAKLMEGAHTQVAVVAEMQEPETGMVVKVKCLLDIVPDNATQLADLKTMSRMDSPRELSSTVHNFGYAYQAALYLDLWNAATGEERGEWVLACQQAEEPYEVVVRQLDPEAVEKGREQYRADITKWCKCVQSGIWPSAFAGMRQIELPAYAYA